MKKLKEELKYGKRGITLISLVVTIIVLLILSGVTIATLTGNNGILTRAQEAKNETEQSEKDEKEKLGDMEDIINEYSTGIKIEQVTDENPGILEIDEENVNTYIINSIEDLVFFANNVTEGNTYEGKTVKLGLSLDFKSNKSYIDPFRTDYGKYGYDGELKMLLTSGEGFIPIGVANNVEQTKYSFNGIFDGNGCIINNLYINKLIEDHINDTRIGFFGNNYGTIENIGLLNVEIRGTLTTTGANTIVQGGIVGCNYGIIQSCFSTGNISSVGKENAKVRVGGISGHDSNGYINNCYNISKISGIGSSSTCIGGIAGLINNTNIENCLNLGDLSINTNGGLLVIGGIAGYTTNAIINNSYNINIINANGNSNNLYVGGIAGYGITINMNNCHDKGIINQNAISDEYLYVAKIIGANYANGTITNCSYLKQEGYNDIGVNGGVVTNNKEIEKENQMPNILDILGSAFKEDTNKINNGYPILSWQ